MAIPTRAQGETAAAGRQALLIFDQRAQSEALGQEFAHDTRMKVFALVSRISPHQLQKRSRTNVILRLSNDVTPLRQWISRGLARSTVAVVSITVTLAALAIIDWHMALIVCAAIAAGIFVAFLLKAPFQNTLTEARKRRGELASTMGERVTSMATIMANRQVPRESRRVMEHSQTVADAMVSRGRYIGILRAFGEGIGGLAMAGALMLGAWQVTTGALTTGTLAAVLSIVRLMSGHFRDLERAYEYWHGARVANRSLDRLMSLRALSRPDSDQKVVPDGGSVSLEGVGFGEIFKDFTATAFAGEKVAIVGPPGSGKSTLFLLIMGLLDPDSGTIRIGGADLRHIPRKLLPDHMGIVSADFPLMRGSIRKNVFYRTKASDDEFATASERSGLAQLVARRAQGLDTRLAEGGSNLSVSERQCIVLARALLGSPPLLLIDESGLAGDLEMKRKLHALMSDYPGTILLITSDEDLAATATKRWELGATSLQADEPADILE